MSAEKESEVERQASQIMTDVCQGNNVDPFIQYRAANILDAVSGSKEDRKTFLDKYRELGGKAEFDQRWTERFQDSISELTTLKLSCATGPGLLTWNKRSTLVPFKGPQTEATTSLSLENNKRPVMNLADRLMQAVSQELSQRYPNLDAQTSSNVRKLIHFATDDFSYRHDAQNRLKDFSSLSRVLLKNPEEHKEAVEIANKLLGASFFNLDVDSRKQPVFKITESATDYLVFDKTGAIVDSHSQGQSPVLTYLETTFKKFSSSQEKVLSKLEEKIFDSMAMSRDSIVTKLGESEKQAREKHGQQFYNNLQLTAGSSIADIETAAKPVNAKEAASKLADDVCNQKSDFARYRTTNTMLSMLKSYSFKSEALPELERLGVSVDLSKSSNDNSKITVKAKCETGMQSAELNNERYWTKAGKSVEINSPIFSDKQTPMSSRQSVQDALDIELMDDRYKDYGSTAKEILRYTIGKLMEITASVNDEKQNQVRTFVVLRDTPANILADPSKAGDLVKDLNRLLSANIFHISTDSKAGQTLTMTANDKSFMKWNNKGELIDARHNGEDAMEGSNDSKWTKAHQILLEVNKTILHQMAFDSNSILRKMNEREKSIRKDLESYFERQVPSADKIMEALNTSNNNFKASEKVALEFRKAIVDFQVIAIRQGYLSEDKIKSGSLPPYEAFASIKMTPEQISQYLMKKGLTKTAPENEIWFWRTSNKAMNPLESVGLSPEIVHRLYKHLEKERT